MTKNKLEKCFSKSLKADDSLWGMKLHNNPLAHQNTPADYIISRTIYDNYISLILILVECKQVTCKDGKGRLAFKRLKQMHDLLNFTSISPLHESNFCIAYYDKRWDNSDVYIVPVKIMHELVNSWDYVSLNREDASVQLKDYKVDVLKGGVIDLKCLKK